MLKMTRKRRYQVKITDCDGNFEILENAAQAAKRLEVKIQTVYDALCYGKKLRGCELCRVSNGETT